MTTKEKDIYIVYMPHSKYSSGRLFPMPVDATVRALEDAIFNHPAFKRRLENDDLILLRVRLGHSVYCVPIETDVVSSVGI